MKSMLMIDRKKVKQAFGKQASVYESHATVQKRIVKRLLETLKQEDLAPRRLLDVGSGTGLLLRSLLDLYGEVCAIGVDHAMGMNHTARKRLENDRRAHILAADAEHLPFSGAVFDLVLSTSTFQWLERLGPAFDEAYRVLAPGGLFCFALFGEKTLHELRDSYSFALDANNCPQNRIHTFLSRDDVDAALRQAGFSGCRVTAQMEVQHHEDVPALLRSLKRIGAGNASPLAPRGLAGKRIMLDMMQRYGDLYGDGAGIPASYEIIYGLGRKPR